MAREIKFRAWDDRHKCYEKVNDFYWFEENGVRVGNGDGSSGSYFIEQFTGIKDKKGREIYEGDVVSIDFDGKTEIGRVFWNDFGASFLVRVNEHFGRNAYFLGDIEVIGNIHEDAK